jgi:hypothetical protein
VRELLQYRTITSTNVAFEVAEPFDLDAIVEKISHALSNEPGLKMRATNIPPDASPDIPRWLYSYHGSKLQVAKTKLVFSIEYKGNAQRNYSICDSLLRKRTHALFDVLVPSILDAFVFVGVVTNINYSYLGTEHRSPSKDLMDHFLKVRPGEGIVVDDTEFRIGYRHESMYFVNLSCSNFEAREARIQIPTKPTEGERVYVPIREHEGDVTDYGIAVIMDVNTKLYQRLHKSFPKIQKSEFDRVLDLVRDVIEQKLDSFLTEATL